MILDKVIIFNYNELVKGVLMFSKELFGERLTKIRLAKNETQEALGKILGVGKTQVSQIENGTASTTIERLALICEYYHVSAEYLLGLSDDPTPHGR